MAARCPGWLAIALLASAACGGPTKPKEPQPPNVSLSPVPREIIGTGFEMIVAVEGCEQVSRVWLTEHETVLNQLDGGGTSNILSVKANHIDYKSLGVPAYLAMFGHATCDTGKQGDSEVQSALFLPAQERSQLPENYYYEHELVGCRCQLADGTVLGEITEMQTGPGGALLVVTAARGEVLVPFVFPIVVKVDLTVRAVVLDPPRGLFDGDAL